MADVFQNTDRMWFGTRERMQWIETPRSGANVSTSGTFAEADLINGGAFVRNSVDAHKNYAFTWGDSADRRLASIIRSYRNGSYGGGPIYFSDPMYYETNLFPQRWADPSMALGEEAPTLTGDIGTLSSTPTAPNSHGLPVTSAVYQFGSITNWTGEQDSAFHLEIPEGMELVIGAYYTATGGARIALRHNGFQRTELPQHSVSDETCMDTIIGSGGSVDIFLESGASPNGTLTIAGMIARLRPVGSGGALDGQTVTNLFTSPNFEGDGTYAEVRRNRLPAAIPSTDWTVQTGTSGAVTTDPDYLNSGFRGFYCRWDTAPTGGNVSIFPANGTGSIVTVTPGETIPISAKVISQRPKVRIVAEWYTSVGSWIAVAANSGYVTATNDPANPTLISAVTDAAPANAARLYVRVMPDIAEMLAGDRIVVGEVMIGHGEYFNGNTTPETAGGVDQPEDFRWRWLGDPNESESVMEIERVAGLWSTNCIAGVSAKNGKPATRLIPTEQDNDNSFASFNIAAGARSGGTLIGTLHLDNSITGTLKAESRELVVAQPWTRFSPKPPNKAGSYSERLVFGALTSSNTAYLFHGGAQGSGDVWWTDIGLFAGAYDGPWVNGTWTFPASGEVGVGEWFVGEGHSGCRFVGSPTVYNNDGIGGGHVSLSCDLRETGAWE